MKTYNKLILSLLVLLLGFGSLSAQTTFAPGFGLGLKASTNGLGGDLIYNFHEKMSLRLGFERLGIKTDFTFKENDVNYTTNLTFKTGSISLLYDYYLARNIFVTAGLGWNLFQAVLDGESASYFQFGDIRIPKEDIGTFNFQLDPSLKISPYMGIGFGRTLGLEKKVGFAFELGGFYQGSPDVSILSTGLLSPTANPDQKQDVKLEKQISQYSIYPVLKLSLSYKLFSL